MDLKFLHTPAGARPTLAVLFEDTRRARHIKTYEVGLREKVGVPKANSVKSSHPLCHLRLCRCSLIFDWQCGRRNTLRLTRSAYSSACGNVCGFRSCHSRDNCSQLLLCTLRCLGQCFVSDTATMFATCTADQCLMFACNDF